MKIKLKQDSSVEILNKEGQTILEVNEDGKIFINQIGKILPVAGIFIDYNNNSLEDADIYLPGSIPNIRDYIDLTDYDNPVSTVGKLRQLINKAYYNGAYFDHCILHLSYFSYIDENDFYFSLVGLDYSSSGTGDPLHPYQGIMIHGLVEGEEIRTLQIREF